MSEIPDAASLAGAAEHLDERVLGAAPTLSHRQAAERAGIPLDLARELWRQLGFPHQDDDAVAFVDADVDALRSAGELVDLGILSPERQAALVRTWGRSFARLAEWQVSLLADVALESGMEPDQAVAELAAGVLPKVEALQAHVWRRHLVSAAGRLLGAAEIQGDGGLATSQAVCFADIVGYTSTSRSLDEADLVAWLEHFEAETLTLAVEHDARIIKSIGDELLLVADDVGALADVALAMTERRDEDDGFPTVRAGLAHGEVVSRLGDVFGPTVNIASRLTQAARPGTVLVDRGAHEALTDAGAAGADDAPYVLKSVRPVSVKGYARLHPWVLRRA